MFGFYFFQTLAAEAVAIIIGDISFFLFGQRDAIALTLEDIAHFAFEGGLAAAALFCFMLAHTTNI
jgi:hypothetical protein